MKQEDTEDNEEDEDSEKHQGANAVSLDPQAGRVPEQQHKVESVAVLPRHHAMPTWAVPITTGAYPQPSSALEPRRCSSGQTRPITTGVNKELWAYPQPIAESPRVAPATSALDEQSTNSKSVNSGEELSGDRRAKDSESYEPPNLESGSGTGTGASERTGAGTPSNAPLRSGTKRKAYKKRSPKAGTAEEEESRKQRRLEKNRATAAVSRERKRAQFSELQIRVAQLEKDNNRLNTELERRNHQLATVKEELASLTKDASRSSHTQHAFQSAVGTNVEASGQPALLDMSVSLRPDDHLQSFKDHFQTLDGRRNSSSRVAHSSWFSSDNMGSTSRANSSYDTGHLDGTAQTTRPPEASVPEKHYQHQSWGQLPLELRQQAQLEYNYGGPIISLEQNSAGLNLPDAGLQTLTHPLAQHERKAVPALLGETSDEERERQELADMLFDFQKTQ